MTHKVKAYKVVEGSPIHHVRLSDTLNIGDTLIVDTGDHTYILEVTESQLMCEGCPFNGSTCLIRNDSYDRILCHKKDGTYVGFRSIDSILEEL
jgi:hypothetical protein